jgi:hypothetical protein
MMILSHSGFLSFIYFARKEQIPHLDAAAAKHAGVQELQVRKVSINPR